MHASKTGEPEGLEAIKWLAFALMVIDHLARYAIDGLGPLPWLGGRLVFPLFAIALGIGLARCTSRRSVFLRLVAWGVAAQLAMLIAAPGTVALNVLFTFAAGVALAEALLEQRVIYQRIAIAIVALLAACLAEYGPIGAGLVAAAIWYGREHRNGALHWPSALALAFGVLMLSPINGTAFGMLALPVAWVLTTWPIEIPRVRRLFYGGYVAQWCLVAGVAWVAR